MPDTVNDHKQTLDVNSAWLRNRVAELGLKQWWLAEQVGVDKKTVIRWLHGHVRAIQVGNARALAAVLGCRIEDLEQPRDAIDLASAADQRAAAALLATSSLHEKLAPVGEWNVIESLIRAVAVPDLPLHVLGTLYNRLCTACWRQGKMNEADACNRAAFDAARRCGDQALLAGAHTSCANLLHWRGAAAQAHEHYRAALALQRFIESAELGAIHSNLGASLYERGELDAGESELDQALALLRFGGSPMQLSVLHCHFAILALRRDDPGAASGHTETSLAHALHADYRRGKAMGLLLDADIAARGGRGIRAFDALACAKAGFAELGIEEGLNFEFEGRVLRLLKRPADALQAVARGLDVSAAFPLEQGQLHLERALAQRDLGAHAESEAAARAAAGLFAAGGAPRLAEVAAALAGAPPGGVSPHVPGAGATKPLP